MSGLPEPGGASARRDNGLPAGAWEPLAWLDPAVGDAALAALAAAGVPALVESAPAGRAPDGRPTPDGRPAPGPGAAPDPTRADGRLLLRVDSSRREEAGAVLARDLPGRAVLLEAGAVQERAQESRPPEGRPDGGGARPAARPLDEDAAWAQIVAGWDSDGGDSDRGDARSGRRPGHGSGLPVPPWPVSEDLPEREEDLPLREERRPSRETDPAGPPPAVRSAGPRDHSPPGDPADEHYVPPPPPPLPKLRRATVGALAALALGIVLLFAPGLIGLHGGDGVAVTGIAAIVGSVVALVYGMRDSGRGTSDPDGGAVV